MLHACRVLRLAVDLRFRVALQRRLHLVDGARDDEPEEQRHQRDDGQVVEQQTDPARDATAAERFDARAHRRREDEREKQKRDHELQLPQCERAHDDAADDEGGDRGALGGLGH